MTQLVERIKTLIITLSAIFENDFLYTPPIMTENLNTIGLNLNPLFIFIWRWKHLCTYVRTHVKDWIKFICSAYVVCMFYVEMKNETFTFIFFFLIFPFFLFLLFSVNTILWGELSLFRWVIQPRRRWTTYKTYECIVQFITFMSLSYFFDIRNWL